MISFIWELFIKRWRTQLWPVLEHIIIGSHEDRGNQLCYVRSALKYYQTPQNDSRKRLDTWQTFNTAKRSELGCASRAMDIFRKSLSKHGHFLHFKARVPAIGCPTLNYFWIGRSLESILSTSTCTEYCSVWNALYSVFQLLCAMTQPMQGAVCYRISMKKISHPMQVHYPIETYSICQWRSWETNNKQESNHNSRQWRRGELVG